MTPAASAAARVLAAPPVSRAPLYFGSANRPLFGWYHAPVSGPALDTTAVICPSVGHEYINAHRSLRHLADRLAAAGIPALRFDYDGTGDSAGADSDPHRLDAWLDSIRAALTAARETSGRDRVALIGLRMGATMAATVACEAPLASLVLWAPCVRGRGFVRELRAMELTTRPARADTTTRRDIEAGGFRATPELQEDFEALNIQRLVPKARRILIADRSDFPEAESVATSWSQSGLRVERREVEGFGAMVLAPHNAVVPTTAIGVIADWVVAQSTLVLPRPRLVARQDTTAPRLATSELRESVLRFGPADAMFGIVTEPPQPPAANTPAIVLSNAGAVHHVGPNGLYVDLARSLSRAGFRVLRFDIPGIGDSVTDGDARENVPYQPDATAILSAAMDALAGRAGVSSFVLMGLCSGAHASFHAAAEVASHRIVEAVLINPLTFNYTTGMSLDAPSMPHIGRWQRYRESMTSVRGWRKLLRPEVRVGELVRDVVRRAALVVGLTPRSRESSAVEAALLRLSDRGRRLTLVCSRFDPGHDLLMLGARRTARALKRAGRLDTWVIDDANHTFDGSRGRAAVVTTITRALAGRYVDRRI